MLPMIFVMPILQLFFLVYATTFEMKNIDLLIIDYDLSSSSREITQKFKASPFFKVKTENFSIEEAQKQIKSGKADIVLNIPYNFEKNLFNNQKADIQILLDAINQTTAAIGNSYCQQIIYNYNKQIIPKIADITTLKNIQNLKSIKTNYQFWYNPELDYKTFMVPGILAILVTIIGLFLSAMNLVKEKEMGTIEQINVTPIKKHQFIIAKMFPFWVIGLFDLALGLFLGKILFNIPMIGSLWTLFFAASIFLFLILGIGLLLSTISDTQQQAMFSAWFFLIIFILMSGLFTSTDSMPTWAQKLNYLNPMVYFIKIMRMVLLKGSGILDIKNELIIMFGYGVTVFSLATMRYKKTN